MQKSPTNLRKLQLFPFAKRALLASNLQFQQHLRFGGQKEEEQHDFKFVCEN